MVSLLIGKRYVIVITDDAVVMADLIRHPRRPREGTVVIVQGYGILIDRIVVCDSITHSPAWDDILLTGGCSEA
jgi:hypothetical protein